MNSEKKTRPYKVPTCLGIEVNLSDSTLKIDPDKLHRIHVLCSQVYEKKISLKKMLPVLIG